MPTDLPTPADREKAREWVRANIPECLWHTTAPNEWGTAFLAGLAAGRAGLRWTGEPPTVPGWWWWRAYPDVGVSVMVQLDDPAGTGLRLYEFDGGDKLVSEVIEDRPHCQWAGPIPTPSEPT